MSPKLDETGSCDNAQTRSHPINGILNIDVSIGIPYQPTMYSKIQSSQFYLRALVKSKYGNLPVSYTHLTLPTILRV